MGVGLLSLSLEGRTWMETVSVKMPTLWALRKDRDRVESASGGEENRWTRTTYMVIVPLYPRDR